MSPIADICPPDAGAYRNDRKSESGGLGIAGNLVESFESGHVKTVKKHSASLCCDYSIIPREAELKLV